MKNLDFGPFKKTLDYVSMRKTAKSHQMLPGLGNTQYNRTLERKSMMQSRYDMASSNLATITNTKSKSSLGIMSVTTDRRVQ